jgi:hypothetical protein
MLTIKIHKAQGAPKDRDIQEITVIADQEVPDCESPAQARKLYQTEAKQLVDALMSCLPGGTIDQILAELMAQKAGLMRTAYREENPK